jgi:hypothetical protein
MSIYQRVEEIVVWVETYLMSGHSQTAPNILDTCAISIVVGDGSLSAKSRNLCKSMTSKLLLSFLLV